MFWDASFRAVDGKAGFGFVIWFDGFWIHARSTNRSKLSSSKEAEVRAILFAMKEARSWGFRKIHLLSDALEVIRAINGLMDWAIQPILRDINELRSKFEDISFFHVPRRLNQFAHELAKNSYRQGVCVGLTRE